MSPPPPFFSALLAAPAIISLGPPVFLLNPAATPSQDIGSTRSMPTSRGITSFFLSPATVFLLGQTVGSMVFVPVPFLRLVCINASW